MSVKYLVCSHCGNMVSVINDSGVPIICCGEKMQELIPNTVDASGEKHLPVVSVENDKVSVNIGAVDHPMIDAHYIQWVSLVTDKGVCRKLLKPNDAPHVSFTLEGEKPSAVYAYCNLHGLWMAQL